MKSKLASSMLAFTLTHITMGLIFFGSTIVETFFNLEINYSQLAITTIVMYPILSIAYFRLLYNGEQQ